MFQFATDAYIVLYAMTILGMSTVSDVPESFPLHGSQDKQKQWLRRVSERVVDFVWLAPEREDVRTVAEGMKLGDGTNAEPFPFCFCGEGNQEVDASSYNSFIKCIISCNKTENCSIL